MVGNEQFAYASNVKAVIDIPEQLYHEAEAKAALLGITMQEVILTALENDLRFEVGAIRRSDQAHSDVDELGIPRLRRSRDDTSAITEDFINQLREQEGI